VRITNWKGEGILEYRGSDSGSLVVAGNGMYAVKMVFSGNTQGKYANIIPTDRILADFGGISLVGVDGAKP
jgi:hypothetical protein